MGIRLKIMVLLAAEVVGLAFYGLVASSLPSSGLRSALEAICVDGRPAETRPAPPQSSPPDPVGLPAGLAGAMQDRPGPPRKSARLHGGKTRMTVAFKVTYATLSADNEELHGQLDTAIKKVQGELNRTYPLFINGKARSTADTTASFNPARPSQLLGRVASATPQDVNDAVAAARAAAPAWQRTPYQERAAIVEKAATIIRQRRDELVAWLILEMGKNRVEALGEIEETADLYDYYAKDLRDNHGYVREMGKLSPTDQNTSVLRPYGVWAVLAPWNFPYALSGAPVAAALLGGNTVVVKPSSETPIAGVKIVEIFHQAGVPAGAVNLITGSGAVAGEALVTHPGVDGVTFTGSYDVGFNHLYKRFSSKYPKPCIIEMGGKNPAIVMHTADLDKAASGVYRSAFGMGGQKCSACSRLYVHKNVADDLLSRLVKLANDTVTGDPLGRTVFLGPVGTKAGFADFQRYVELGRKDGKILAGGETLSGEGYFARPTIIAGLPRDHSLMVDELFLPILCVQTVESFDEAMTQANQTPYGLTAGLFTGKQEEIDQFLERIEAGVVYINRSAGATTGAWPGVQPFGGWKGSGSSGKNIGGHYTVPLYMREQSRTIVS
ncbi:MAG TPA: aldehyde dehydrogenase family protein [Candidatus Xenobia bacterium]|jgi:1-pyrroline-5-carboxylate dehydrogenase